MKDLKYFDISSRKSTFLHMCDILELQLSYYKNCQCIFLSARFGFSATSTFKAFEATFVLVMLTRIDATQQYIRVPTLFFLCTGDAMLEKNTRFPPRPNSQHTDTGRQNFFSIATVSTVQHQCHIQFLQSNSSSHIFLHAAEHSSLETTLSWWWHWAVQQPYIHDTL